MLANVKGTPQNISDLIQSVALHLGTKGQFARFKKLYAHDRIAFVYDCLPAFAKTMAPYQEEILGYFDEGFNRVSVRGPHGLGKTALASILTQHSVLTAESDCKVPTTASAWRQLEKYLWPEIKKTAKFLDWMHIGREPYTREELLNISIKLNGGTVEAFAVASDDHTTIEGAHATRIVYIFDESKTIPRATWDAAEGAFSTEGLKASDYERGVIPIGKKEYGDLENNIYSDMDNIDNSLDPTDTVNVKGKSYIGSNKRHSGSTGGSGRNINEESNKEVSPVNALSNISNKGVGRSLSSGAIQNTQPCTQNTQPFEAINPAGRVLSDRIAQSSAPTSINSMLEDHRQLRTVPTSSTIYEAIAFAISTPGDPSGQFYDIHMKKRGYEDWKVRHVTIDEAIAAGRVSGQWVEQRRMQWGEDSSVFINRVLGEFADNSEEGVVPLSWIRAANARWLEWERKGFPVDDDAIETLGVDVARSGEDKTVIAHRLASGVSKIHIYSKLLITNTAGTVKSLCQGKKVHIEMDGGLGASVYDILREEGVRGLVPITVGASTTWRDRSGELGFQNVRAAMWWNMRELLDPTYNSEVMLPPLEELTLDLSTPKWEIMKDAIVRLESKKSIAARIGRSTDYGDAVCLAFWNATRGGGVVF